MFNKDLLYTLLNQLWRIISGPLILLFIPLYLTPMEQGYWYTFISIGALGLFADLGFSNIVLIFASHEFAHLSFTEDKKFIGNEEHLQRLATFFRFSVRWILRAVLIVFPLIMIGGYFFLLQKQTVDMVWIQPWIVYACASSITFVYSSFLFFFEGCDSVSVTQNIRFQVAIGVSCAMLLGLFLGLHLYALAISSVVSCVFGFGLLLKKFKTPMKQLWQLSKTSTYNWWPEFSSLLWRYAISWSSGYFLFQTFVPITFHYHGPVVAGKVGISIALWTAAYNISTTWLTAVTPKINMLVSERQWSKLDKLFKNNLFRALGTFFVGGSCFLILFYVFHDKIHLLRRFLPFTAMCILFMSWLCQVLVNSLAIYLRAHKKEPMMTLSAVSAVYVFGTTYLCAKYLSEEWLFLGMLSSYVWGIPIIMNMIKKQRREHGV